MNTSPQNEEQSVTSSKTSSTPPVVMDAIRRASGYLKEKGIKSHRLDAELIIAHLLGVNRIDVYLMYDRPLSDGEWKGFAGLIEKRVGGYPTAYITGKKEFWSIDITVTESVLIPRPETEVLVEETLKVARCHEENCLSILEIGTGSGAVALALSRELPSAEITATDISDEALSIAGFNLKAQNEKDRIELLSGNLYDPIRGRGGRGGRNGQFHIIVSNPPYVTLDEMDELPLEVKMEPEIALNGGDNGLDVIKPLVSSARDFLNHEGHLLLEVAPGQVGEITELINGTYGLSFSHLRDDYSGNPRIIVAKKVD